MATFMVRTLLLKAIQEDPEWKEQFEKAANSGKMENVQAVLMDYCQQKGIKVAKIEPSQNMKGIRVGEITFTCPNSYCKRTITRSVWSDGEQSSAYACCNCGAQLHVVVDADKIVEIRWVNKKFMDLQDKERPLCDVCSNQIGQGGVAHYRGFIVHKGDCLEVIRGRSVKILLLNRTSICMRAKT